MRLSLKVLRKHGFDAVHACNPPDLIFLVALFHKLFFGKKFIFDQHDINPELYEVKFGKKGFFHKLLTIFERCTFKLADGSLATNETLKGRAIDSPVVEHRHDTRVMQLARDARFVEKEARGAFVLGKLGQHALDGDATGDARLGLRLRHEHLSHSPLTQSS